MNSTSLTRADRHAGAAGGIGIAAGGEDPVAEPASACSTQAASSATISHQRIEMLKKLHFGREHRTRPQPASLIETLLEPEMSRDRPSAVPARMKFEASVTMKLGRLGRVDQEAR